MTKHEQERKDLAAAIRVFVEIEGGVIEKILRPAYGTIPPVQNVGIKNPHGDGWAKSVAMMG